MSNSFRFSRLLPRFLRSDKNKSNSSDWEFHRDKPKDGHVCKVLFLDETELSLPFKGSSKGNELLDKVFNHLNLVEKDYFGLRYLDSSDQTHWLDNQKSLSSQLKGCSAPYLLYFGVKFYPVDPCKLKEEITRYQFYLQVKHDIVQGRLPVTFEEAAELFAYAIQSELGDFNPQHLSQGYVSEFRFVPNQTEELEDTIAALHRRLGGVKPSHAEYKFLDKVKWLDMYGVDLHPVMGEGNTEYFLGLTPMGIVVYKNKTKVGNYFWPRINKVTFKGKIFIIKVKDKNNDEHTYAFEVVSKLACKHLWKCCVEHHAFFRLRQASDSYARSDYSYRPTSRSRRASGRHERLSQTDTSRQQPNVNRVPSKRHQRRTSSDSRLSAHGEGMPHLTSGISVTRMSIQPPDKGHRYNRSLPDLQRGSPKSTRSAPWETDGEAGLYMSGKESPLSMYSDAARSYHRRVGPPSDTESGYRRKHMYFPRGKGSDNESDVSFSRRRRREVDSGSESDVSATRPRNRRPKSSADDWFENQWKEAMEGMYIPNKENLPNGSAPSIQSAPTGDFAAKRRRRRRSKSPGNKPPEELRQHFQYNLVDTEGMTEAELQDIPFIKVETKAEPFRVKYSPKTRQRYRSPKRKSTGDLEPDQRLGVHLVNGDDAPPPYPGQDLTPTPESMRRSYYSDSNSNYKLKSRNDRDYREKEERNGPPYRSLNESQRSRSGTDGPKRPFNYLSQDAISLNSHDTLRSRDFDSTTISSEQASLGTSLDDGRAPGDQKFESRMENLRGSNRYDIKREEQLKINDRPNSSEQNRTERSRSGRPVAGHPLPNEFNNPRQGSGDTRNQGQSKSYSQDNRYSEQTGQRPPTSYNPEARSNEPSRSQDWNRSQPVQYQLRSSQRSHNKGHITPSSITPNEEEGVVTEEVKKEGECNNEEETAEFVDEELGDEEAGSRQARSTGPPPLPQRDQSSVSYSPNRPDQRGQSRGNPDLRNQGRMNSNYMDHRRMNGSVQSHGMSTSTNNNQHDIARVKTDLRDQGRVNTNPRNEGRMNYDPRNQGRMNGNVHNQGVSTSTNISTPPQGRQGYTSVQDRPLPQPPVGIHNSPGTATPNSKTYGTSDSIKKLYSTPQDAKRIYATQDSIRRLYNQSDGQSSPSKGVSTNRNQNVLSPLSQNNYSSSSQKSGPYSGYTRSTQQHGGHSMSRGMTTQNMIDKSVIPRTVLDPGHNRDLWTEI